MPDRVRPLKIETPAEGGTQSNFGPTEMDSHQDALDGAGMYVQDTSTTVSDTAVFYGRTPGTKKAVLQDADTTTNLGNLVNAVAGTKSAHNALLDVIHYLTDGPGDAAASGCVAVDTNNGPLRTQTVWYTDGTQAKILLAWNWTYTGPLKATQKLTLYAADGVTVARTVTDTYSYAGPIRTMRVRTFGTT